MAEFKVICINDKGWDENVLVDGVVKRIDADGPAMNEICTVTAEKVCPLLDFQVYIIKGWSRDDNDGYNTKCFLPLDDFKEVTFTELKEQMPVSVQ